LERIKSAEATPDPAGRALFGRPGRPDRRRRSDRIFYNFRGFVPEFRPRAATTRPTLPGPPGRLRPTGPSAGRCRPRCAPRYRKSGCEFTLATPFGPIEPRDFDPRRGPAGATRTRPGGRPGGRSRIDSI